MSNWLQATGASARAIEQALVCPKCSAANRPGACIIELDARTWVAVCGVCSHDFVVDDRSVATAG